MGAGQLVGRAGELASTTAAIRRGASGPATGVLIEGEAGIGKTSVLDAALDDVDPSWCRVRIGFTPAERQIAWSGLAALWPQLETSIDTADQRAEAISIALGATADGRPAAALRSAVASAVRDAFAALVAQHPLVVAIDDLHWADAATAGVMTSAIRVCLPHRCTVVATARPGHDLPIDLRRLFGDRMVAVHPRPLTADEVRTLMRSTGLTVSVAMLEEVQHLSRGNPLHVRRLVDEIARAGWRPGHLPPTIAAGIAADLARLGRDDAQLLAAAALHGEIDTVLLQAAFDWIDVDRSLARAERAGLLVARPGGAGEHERLVFSHPLIAAAAAEHVGLAGRREAQRRLAGQLAPDDEMRAVHLAAAAAGVDGDAADAIDTAAVRARQRGDSHVAGQRFERAALLTPGTVDGTRWQRQLMAADAYLTAGDLGAASPLATAAYESSVDLEQVALAGGLVTQVMASRGDMVETQRFVADLLVRLAGAPALKGFLGRAAVRLGQIIDLHGALELAVELRDEMVAAGLDELAEEFYVLESACRYLLGESVDVVSVWRRARRAGSPLDTTSGCWFGVELMVWSRSDPDLTTEALSWFVETTHAAGAMQAYAKALDARATHVMRGGDLSGGEAEIRLAVDVAEMSELTGAMTSSALGWVLAVQGRDREAVEVMSKAPTAHATEATPTLYASHRAVLGMIAVCAGRWEQAVDELTKAWASADKVGLGDLAGMPFRADLVEVLAQLGRPADARALAAEVSRLAERQGRPAALIQAHRAQCLANVAAGDLVAAIAAATAGLAVPTHLVDAVEAARMRLAAGVAHRRSGARSQAAALLNEALASFLQMGATPFAERTRLELDRLGTVRRDEALTSTEEAIARLAADGMSNAEIAGELFVSLRTVESHLTRVYRKLGIRSRAQLARHLTG